MRAPGTITAPTQAPVASKPSSRLAMKRLGRRKPPYPNSILDRPAFEAALAEEGVPFKKPHIDAFYQALHRQHYPPLAEFVRAYYFHDTNIGKVEDKIERQQPLKNAVSMKKNRNRLQLPKGFLAYLSSTNDWVTLTSSVAEAKTSADGSTTKLAVRLHDGQLVESVLMRYGYSGPGAGESVASKSRASLCVSSQCGCAMGCTFCATGTMGLSGNLTVGEILEQLVHADRILADEWKENANARANLELVRNVVFMGMGEPLDNYRNVVEACRAMIDRKRWNLAQGRVTVSTVGLVDQIRHFTLDLPEISLAVSLHAPNQALREQIVPTAKNYPIEDLIEALDQHMLAYLRQRRPRHKPTREDRILETSRRRAMIEYIMIEGPTSTLDAAHELGRLCEDRHLVVNLIPYNATDVEDELRCPSEEHVLEFRNIVQSYGSFCTIRRTMGADIDSACGQLITLAKDKNAREDAMPLDIEDVGRTKAARKAPSVIKRKVLAVTATAAKPEPDSSLERWIRPLAIATSVAAFSFALSTVMYVRQRRR